MPQPIEIEYTASGYLILPAETARTYFPGDVLLFMVKGDELWILPTRGAAAGGLLMKQRNAAGDRSVLASPYLPDETPAGRWLAFWDERNGAMRVAFRAPQLEPGIASKTVVEFENGRWVVYLDTAFPSSESGIRVDRKRIADYSDEKRARVAANWIERTADRDLKRPPTGL